MITQVAENGANGSETIAETLSSNNSLSTVQTCVRDKGLLEDSCCLTRLGATSAPKLSADDDSKRACKNQLVCPSLNFV
jgi:hypothetical protein